MTDGAPAAPAVGSGLLRLSRALAPARRMRLEDYFAEAWKVIEPGKPLVRGWHLGYMCEHLEAVSLGQIKRLIINIFPRSLKSSLCSVAWPTWEWGPGGRPDLRYLFISHEQTLSTEFSVNRRLILESEWYQREWPKVVIASDQNEKKLLHNTRRGKMIATSTRGSATGKGGSRIVIDDYLDPDEAESDIERARSLLQWEKKFSSRLDDPMKDAIVVVEQRLHPKDFTAKLIAEGGWERIVIPCDNYTKEPLFFSFPLSGRVVEVKPGEATFPERKPLSLIAQERARGTRTHDAQQRQNPSDDANAMFPEGRWRFYTSIDEVLTRINEKGEREKLQWDDLIQSWDCAFKGTEDSDFVVGQVWGRLGANRYLLDQFRGQVGVKGTLQAIADMSEKWPRAHRKLVEDKANGPAVIELLSLKVPGLIAVNPEGGKIVRARAVEPFSEARNLFLPTPDSCAWVQEFMTRAAAFPNVDFDDEIDAMTQANIYFTSDLEPKLTVG